jgi:hypothetical protein
MGRPLGSLNREKPRLHRIADRPLDKAARNKQTSRHSLTQPAGGFNFTNRVELS